MPKEFSRSRRIGTVIQRELSDIISRELTWTQFGMLTVSAVDVSPDLQQAKIYITRLGEHKSTPEAVIQGLTQRAGHLRHELSQRLNIRGTPRLYFVYDHSVEYGNRLSQLIDSANKKNTDTNSEEAS